jgi:hypothetical protein
MSIGSKIIRSPASCKNEAGPETRWPAEIQTAPLTHHGTCGAQVRVDASSEHLDLAVLTHQVSDELGLLAHLAGDVQIALSMCQFDPAGSQAAIKGLQQIDRLTQTLEDLSRMTGVLATLVPNDLAVSKDAVLAPVVLRDLVSRFDKSTGATSSPLPSDEVLWL